MQGWKTCKRYNLPGHAHELTFSCFKHRPFLSRERTCVFLAQAIRRAKTMHRFHLWAYVFMPEHVHLLLWPEESQYSISKFLQATKQSVSRRALNYLRKENPDGLRALATGRKDKPYQFWLDGGGYDRNITGRATLIRVVDYIHNNPVRRGLVKAPQEWLWSSATQWMGIGEGLIQVDLHSFPLL